MKSGRWEPPAAGWLVKMTSFSLNSFLWDSWYCTASCMEPKWTGIWGALETKPPSGPKSAQEKSKRSLMLVEIEVLWRILKEYKFINDSEKYKTFHKIVILSKIFYSKLITPSPTVKASLLSIDKWDSSAGTRGKIARANGKTSWIEDRIASTSVLAFQRPVTVVKYTKS